MSLEVEIPLSIFRRYRVLHFVGYISRSEISISIDKIIDDFLKESEVDYVAMWEVTEVARDDLNAETDDEARAISLELVRKLYDHGLRPGDYWGGGFAYWSENGCQAVVDRIEREWIEREWIELGHDPDPINPICWFAPRQA